ncbi:hypothetical protein [Pseudomonas azotoformans]|uniref:hypothetical protein n=1 Tax=Pseudomonas azotoformans TaxID=47878 RepID=UPI001CB77F4D|nr:hypothetical protein [Pseudomonas azotoformans]UMY48054.1 hypothetical protein MLC69_22550 [Pseudomonas azotoformans]
MSEPFELVNLSDRYPGRFEGDRNGGGDDNGSRNPPGPPGDDPMEARVAKLETHVEYIRRDLDEVRADVKIIKNRLAYFAGASLVIVGILAWIANNRFDQVLQLLTR